MNLYRTPLIDCAKKCQFINVCPINFMSTTYPLTRTESFAYFVDYWYDVRYCQNISALVHLQNNFNNLFLNQEFYLLDKSDSKLFIKQFFASIELNLVIILVWKQTHNPFKGIDAMDVWLDFQSLSVSAYKWIWFWVDQLFECCAEYGWTLLADLIIICIMSFQC